MASVTNLPQRGGRSCVSVATDLLNEAVKGELEIIAVAKVHTDGDISFTITGGDHVYKLLGAIEHMKWALLLDKEQS
jgi:hypothetical protein